MSENWKPVPREDAMSLIGEGLHTALRKIADSEEAAVAWKAIYDMDSEEWSGYLAFLIEGMRYTGYEVCQKEGS